MALHLARAERATADTSMHACTWEGAAWTITLPPATSETITACTQICASTREGVESTQALVLPPARVETAIAGTTAQR